MAIIDYKEKYEKAVQAAMLAKQDTESAVTIGILEEIFPELRESKDERIRKALIRYFTLSDEHAYNEACGVSYRDIVAWLEKQGEQKPADKAEPKFHEGDWVVSPNGVYWHIDKISNNRYEVTSNTGESSNWPLDTNIYRSFSIQDARDGDVLANDYHEIFIFKNIKEDTVISYCSIIDRTSDVIVNSFDEMKVGYTSVVNFYPATKEQRNTLTKAMADAGYTFDFEKKEMKKIERNPTDEVGNYNHKEVLQAIINEQKPAWSEEDEKMIQDIINDIAIAQEQVYCKSRCEDEINWLKSLKERVQPNQEWSEEDRRMLIGLIDELDAIMNKATPNEISVYSKYSNWLNSIKDRFGCKVNCTTTKEWNPSDEQMSVIEAVINNRSFQRRLLVSLYEQLKKLRKE